MGLLGALFGIDSPGDEALSKLLKEPSKRENLEEAKKYWKEGKKAPIHWYSNEVIKKDK